MNSRLKITLLTTLLSTIAVGCTQRSYVMSFAESGAARTSQNRFGTHATLEDRKQTPDKVTAPNSGQNTQRQTRTQQNSSKVVSKEAIIDNSTDQNIEDPDITSTYDHTFTGNETEHIKFSAYDPFNGTGSSFSINLDNEAANFTYPINGKFSSAYGRRGRGTHAGVDLVAPLNTPIYAAFDGTVRLAKPYSGYGNVIVIRHNNGLETVYAHCSKNLVAVGQSVKSGDHIAQCGRTGRATTEHLHFEVRVKGQTINPALLIDTKERRIQSGVLNISRTPSGNVSAKLASDRAAEPTAPQYASNNATPTAPTAAPTTKKSEKNEVLTADNNHVEVPPAYAAIAPTVQSKGIRVGDTIYDAPASTPQKPAAAPSEAKYHTIVGGDSLSRIAQKYQTTVAKLCELNNMGKNDVIRTGKKLRVK